MNHAGQPIDEAIDKPAVDGVVDRRNAAHRQRTAVDNAIDHLAVEIRRCAAK